MALRVTREYADILGSGEGKVRVTRQYVEMLSSGATKARVARQYVEILASLSDDVVCVSRQCVAVLGDPPEVSEIFVNASDTISLGESAGRITVQSVSASDALSLDEDVRRVWEASASDTVSLSDQAQGALVRVAYDTISLGEEAIADVQVTRHVIDSLVLTCEASFIGEWPRFATDTLVLQDQADVSVIYKRRVFETLTLSDEANRIISASDAISLVEVASAERIIASTDSLSLSDEATSYTEHTRTASDLLTLHDGTHPGHTTQRDVADDLSLSEEAVGDRCRVVEDSLSLSDEAGYEFVRLIHDELALTDEASFVGVFRRRVWETVVLSEEVHHNKELDATAEDIVSLSDAATLIFEAFDALDLSDEALGVAGRPAYDTLSLSESAVATRDRQSASDELVLSEEVTLTLVKNVKAADLLIFSERAWPGFHRVECADVLQTEYVSYDPYTYEEIITYEGLQDTASASLIPAAPHEESDHFYLSDRAECIKINADAIEAIASDVLLLTEKASRNRLGDATDLIVPTETAEVVSSKLIVEDLELSESASYNITRNSLAASDTLELHEAVLWYNNLDDYLYVYHPFVGEASGDLPDPPLEELDGPIPGITDPFKLVYPVTGPFSDTLVLRAPNLGNRDRLQMNRISRETRGGTLIVYADLMWPKINTLVLNFSGLSWVEASGLHTFMDSHLGQEIGVLDWEHRFWSGVITKLDDPITQDGKGCQYSVGFEFEGELATYDPGP